MLQFFLDIFEISDLKNYSSESESVNYYCVAM